MNMATSLKTLSFSHVARSITPLPQFCRREDLHTCASQSSPGGDISKMAELEVPLDACSATIIWQPNDKSAFVGALGSRLIPHA
ncbi:uncharacterized protein LOC118534292 isoform X2 [Halichoerus grypus]